jgi:hypothetical protein
MKKIQIVIVFATLVNVAIFGMNHLLKNSKTRVSLEKTSTKNDLYKVNEALFCKALLDENKLVPSKAFISNTPLLVIRFSFRNCDQCKTFNL